jgi:hypothetical protein
MKVHRARMRGPQTEGRDRRARERMRTLRLAAAVLTCCASLGAIATGGVPAAIAAKSPFRTGLYVGKTSEGEPVRFTVAGCGSKQCLESAGGSYFSVGLSCPSSGQTEEQLIELPAGTIARNGTVTYSVGASPGATEKRASEKFKVARNGTLTGRIRLSETLETGTRCESGDVTLKAKIGGLSK